MTWQIHIKTEEVEEEHTVLAIINKVTVLLTSELVNSKLKRLREMKIEHTVLAIVIK